MYSPQMSFAYTCEELSVVPCHIYIHLTWYIFQFAVFLNELYPCPHFTHFFSLKYLVDFISEMDASIILLFFFLVSWLEVNQSYFFFAKNQLLVALTLFSYFQFYLCLLSFLLLLLFNACFRLKLLSISNFLGWSSGY